MSAFRNVVGLAIACASLAIGRMAVRTGCRASDLTIGHICSCSPILLTPENLTVTQGFDRCPITS